MNIIKKLAFKYSLLSLSVRLFALLIISTIVVLISAWALNFKYEDSFYILSKNSITFSALFNPAKDGGYFEGFQYILLMWCAMLSAIWVIGRKYFDLIYIPLIYLFLFLDDAFLLHDRIAGNYITKIYEKIHLFNNDYIRVKDFAEWSYWFIIFFIILILAKSSFQNKEVIIQKFIKNNFCLFFGMAFFALFIDLIHANFYRWIAMNEDIKALISILLMLLEEVGEIGVVSIACVWLFSRNFGEVTKIKNLKD